MRDYLQNRWIRVGLVLVVFGWGPLFVVGFLSMIGIGDPNPNPIGLGLLFLVTSWPAVICLLIGWARVHDVRRKAAALDAPGVTRPAPARAIARDIRVIASYEWTEQPAVRITAAGGGLVLLVYGTLALVDGEGRGAAAAMLIGVAAIYTGVTGRLPHWFRR